MYCNICLLTSRMHEHARAENGMDWQRSRTPNTCLCNMRVNNGEYLQISRVFLARSPARTRFCVLMFRLPAYLCRYISMYLSIRVAQSRVHCRIDCIFNKIHNTRQIKCIQFLRCVRLHDRQNVKVLFIYLVRMCIFLLFRCFTFII
jgi:hypothetical protein